MNCKYCDIPFTVNQLDEDDFEVYCSECGYDVS